MKTEEPTTSARPRQVARPLGTAPARLRPRAHTQEAAQGEGGCMSDDLTPDHLLAELGALQRKGVNYDTRRIAGQAKEYIEKLLRGEFICAKCGLRKDGETNGQPDF